MQITGDLKAVELFFKTREKDTVTQGFIIYDVWKPSGTFVEDQGFLPYLGGTCCFLGY